MIFVPKNAIFGQENQLIRRIIHVARNRRASVEPHGRETPEWGAVAGRPAGSDWLANFGHPAAQFGTETWG